MHVESRYLHKQVYVFNFNKNLSLSGPQKWATTRLSKYRIKSYYSLPMRLDFDVKLKYESSTIKFFVDIKYSVRDLLCGVINNGWPAK